MVNSKTLLQASDRHHLLGCPSAGGRGHFAVFVSAWLSVESPVLVRRPDVVSGLQVRGRVRPFDRYPGLGEGREVIAVRDVIAVIVAHSPLPLTVNFHYLCLYEHADHVFRSTPTPHPRRRGSRVHLDEATTKVRDLPVTHTVSRRRRIPAAFLCARVEEMRICTEVAFVVPYAMRSTVFPDLLTTAPARLAARRTRRHSRLPQPLIVFISDG